MSILGRKIFEISSGFGVHDRELPDYVAEALPEDLCYEDKDLDAVCTPLMVAARRGNTELMAMLIQAGVNVDYQDSQDGNTALILAVQAGRTEAIEVLLQAGADPNIQGKDDQTALMWAACSCQPAIAAILIHAGAAVNLQNSAEETALMWAARHGHTCLVRALVEAGADVDVQNSDGSTALALAAHSGYSLVVQELLLAGADRNIRDKKGHTAAERAAHGKIKTMITAYVHNPLDPTQAPRNSLGATDATVLLLGKECDNVIALCLRCPRHREALMRQYETVLSAKEDYRQIATLGKAVNVALSEAPETQELFEDYLTLVDRHAGLAHRVADKCKELANLGDFENLSVLAENLVVLTALKMP